MKMFAVLLAVASMMTSVSHASEVRAPGESGPEVLTIDAAAALFTDAATFVDVRRDHDVRIFNAIRMPFSTDFRRGALVKVADLKAPLVVHCEGADCLAADLAQDWGYENVLILNSQTSEWIDAGYPVAMR